MLYRLTLVAIALPCFAAPSPAKFDVASVNSSRIGETGSESSRRESIEPAPDGLAMRNVSLRSCLLWAYRLRDYQISGPAWLAEERYDIVARSAQPAAADQLREMLQSLLEERLGIRLHRESRELPVYALRADKNGAKLRRAPDGGQSEMRMKDGALIFASTSLSQLAGQLETMRRQVDRPVVDRTGLAGLFDFSLKFADTDAEMRAAMVRGDGVSVFSILRQQLGLRLEAEQAPVEIIVIDHAARIPSPN